jgi:hypothetical protein
LSIENSKVVPKVGDLWLLVATMSSHHQVRFFFPQINVLFVVKDKVVRVEHFGVESKVFVWRLGKKNDGEWIWNFEHEKRMHYERHQLSMGAYTIINDDPNQDLKFY